MTFEERSRVRAEATTLLERIYVWACGLTLFGLGFYAGLHY